MSKYVKLTPIVKKDTYFDDFAGEFFRASCSLTFQQRIEQDNKILIVSKPVTNSIYICRLYTNNHNDNVSKDIFDKLFEIKY